MKVVVDSKELRDVLVIMNEIRDSDLVCFEFFDDFANVFAMNSAAKVSAKVMCSIEGGGYSKIALNKKGMLDIIKRLGKRESSISIEVVGGNINISGDGEFKLKLEEPPENDLFVIPNNILTFQFYIETFARALDRVVYAPPKDVVKSCSDGVYIVDGRIFYSGDGYRLMRYEEEVFPDIVASRLAISVSNANLLVRAMNATVEKIGGIGVSDGVMLVELENYKIWVKCEDYSSCDFDVILDEGYKSTVSIDANVLISMLGHIKNVLKSEYVEVKTSSNGVKLNIGRDVEKVFNVQYLIDMLKPVSDQMVELCCFSATGEPGGCVSVTADSGKYRAIVMG